MTKKPTKAPASKKPAAKKESSPDLSTLGSKAMRGEALTKKEIARLGASVVSQDEKKGQK